MERMGIDFGFTGKKKMCHIEQAEEPGPRTRMMPGSRLGRYFFVKVKPSPVVRTMSLSLVPEGGFVT
jgi:hypothetical protein